MKIFVRTSQLVIAGKISEVMDSIRAICDEHPSLTLGEYLRTRLR